MIVRKAIEENLTTKQYPPRKQSHLWVSAIGGCPRSAIFSLLGHKKETEFPLSLLEKFRFGNVLEDDTGKALKKKYNRDLTDQVVLKTKVWSGKCDWGIHINKQDPILIEHKATGSKYWGKYGSPPTESHVAQLVLYGQLYKEIFNVAPLLVLYYRAWNNWAELILEDLGDTVKITGQMDGKSYNKKILINVTKRRAHLEEHFVSQELPPYVEVEDCTFRGKPSCPYFNKCHEGIRSNVAEWGLF